MNAGANPIRRLRLILLPVGALLLAGLLLFTWMNALAADPAEAESARSQAAILPAANAAGPAADSASEAGNNAGVRPAPLQQTIDYSITPVGSGIFTFTLGTSSNNTYIFAVGSTNWITNSIPIIVNYPLPDGITWTPANSGNWNCLALSNTRLARCIYNLPGARNFDLLYINVNVSRNALSNTTNTVTLEVDDSPNQGNNSAPVTTVIDSVDLGLRKTAFPTNILSTPPDNVVDYTLTITNAGPANPRGVYVIDNVPREYMTCVETTGGTPPGTTYNANTGRWDVGSTAIPSAGLALTIRCTALDTADGRLVSNNASVSSANAGDWNTANNTATASIVVGGLNFTKAADRTSARAGEPVVFTLRVANPTTNPLSNVQITDILMPGFDFVSAQVGTTNVGTYSTSSRTFSYFRGNLPGSTTFDVLLTVRPSTNISATATITNVATIAWGSGTSRVTKTTEPEVEVFVSPGGYLQVGSTNGVNRVTPGQYITYTVSVTNTGSLRVNNVVIDNAFQRNVVALSINTNSLGTGSCTQIACRLTLFDSLDPREKVSFTIGARVNLNATDNDYIELISAASGSDPNSVAVSDSFSERDIIDVVPQSDLTATKSVRPSQAAVGESFTFRINVTNDGTTTIDDMRIGDEFAAVLDLTNVTTNRGTATLNTGARTIDVNVGDLQPGQTVRVEVVAKVNTTATDIETYENVARIRFTGGSTRTNQVRFRVTPSGTLPGTGWEPRANPPVAGPPSAMTAAGGGVDQSGPLATAAAVMIGIAVIAGGLGLMLLVIGLYVRIRRPLHSGGYLRTGLILTVLGIASFTCGWVLFPAAGAPATQLGILRGNKPPLATRAALEPGAPPAGEPAQTSPEAGGVLPGPSGSGAETEPPFEPALPGDAPTNTPDPSIAQYEPTPTPLTLPSYPIPQPTAMVSQGPGGIEPDASQVTRLVIPKLGLDTVVRYVPFNGDTWLIGGLRNEIAWMGNTSWPGLGGNTGLAGHVDLSDGSSGPFFRLDQLSAGDQVQVYTEKYVYTYTVSAEKVVDDHDLTVVDPTTSAQVTLITCTGWDPGLNVYLQRLIVTAGLASVQQVTAGN